MTKYITQELARYWPVAAELMAQYRDRSHTAEDRDGFLIWEQNVQRHRDGDKPAVICADGTLAWYQNGYLHRDGDKPAYVGVDGSLWWMQNDVWHRCCGPAVIHPNGKLEWCINGQDITQDVRKWLNRKHWSGTPEQIVEFQLRFL